MRIVAFIFAIFALMACVVNAQAPVWNSCGSDDDHFKIYSVSISPNGPVSPGQTVSVSVNGNLDEEVTGGTVSATITMNGMPFPAIKKDICTISDKVKCPMPAGNTTLFLSQQFPAFLPGGQYSGGFTVVDQNNEQLACITFSFVVKTAAPEDDQPVLDDAIIAHVNKQGKWKAARNPRFEGVTMGEVKKLLGTQIKKVEKIPRIQLHAESIPASFDSRTQWPNCIHPIRNQEQCGSCWAFGATEALSDRFCIASKGAINVVLSPQDLVSCDSTNYGCEGGYLEAAWEYMETKGVVTDACMPYTSGDGNAPACPSRISCQDGSTPKYYKVKQGSIVQPSDVESIQTLIMTSGPVEAAFSVYQDFFAYKSGVYVHQTGSLAGGHAVKIVGWGVDNATNQPYWIVANSWGTDWGLNGYFWILRGEDECGIEDNVVAGTPAL